MFNSRKDLLADQLSRGVMESDSTNKTNPSASLCYVWVEHETALGYRYRPAIRMADMPGVGEWQRLPQGHPGGSREWE
jgi:hypothetical protein